jgi:crotonobetainyl-CoA:carnitine CoA-transferase CaiB-like acyl-CoA transferase
MNPLDGLRVLDLSEVVMAPSATQVLADYGADVIKIERPGGEILRRIAPASSVEEPISCYYAALNRAKRSVCLDLKSAADRDSLLTLVRDADVLVHNFRPGAMERIGLGYAHLEALNSRLIHAVGLGFGHDGPLANRPGQDLLAQSISGIAERRAGPTARPHLHPIPFIDYAAGQTLAQGILLAVLERFRSGRGQLVSTSLYDTALATQSLEASSIQMRQIETNWVADRFPNTIFQTSDGWITVLGLFRPNPLGRLCQALGLDDLSLDRRYQDEAAQHADRHELNALIAPLIEKLTTYECIELLTGVDMLCAPVLTLAEALQHPQTAQNRSLVEVEVSQEGSYRLVRGALRFSRTEPRASAHVPRLGEHNEDVLSSDSGGWRDGHEFMATTTSGMAGDGGRRSEYETDGGTK